MLTLRMFMSLTGISPRFGGGTGCQASNTNKQNQC